MAFNIIDFLLGSKKGKDNQNQAQNQNPAQPSQGQQPAGDPGNPQSPQASGQDNQNFNPEQGQPGQPQQRAKISDIIVKMQEEVKGTSEKITALVTDVKNLENTVNTMGHRMDDVEEFKKNTEEKLTEVDNNMTKFLSLYELINNQYNPFVDKDMPMPQAKEIMIDSSGSTMPQEDEEKEELSYSDVKQGFDHSIVGGHNPISVEPEPKPMSTNTFRSNNVSAPQQSQKPNQYAQAAYDQMDSAILELDTLNIQEAAGDAVPLTHLKTNTNSLVTILSWLEYLIKRVGIEETRNTLRYYTEVLRWLTPEVFFDLDKYLRGMNDKRSLNGDERLSVKDHIVSLYFISKLNERNLDPQLTKAVLQIIKH